MAGVFRTPFKTTKGTRSPDTNGTFTITFPSTNVRKSIGELEAGNSNKTPPPSSSSNILDVDTAPAKIKKTRITKQKMDTVTKTLDLTWSPPQSEKYKDKIAEAKACLIKAKTSLGSQNNIKTEVKKTVVAALDRLYEIIKEKYNKGQEGNKNEGTGDKEKEVRGDVTAPTISKEPTANNIMQELVTELREHKKAIAECEHFTLALSQQLKEATAPRPPGATSEGTSYANVASRRTAPTRPPLHSIIVSSEDEMDTCSKVVDKIRAAVDARESGLRVDKLRKIRDQRVVVGCGTKCEVERIATKLRGSAAGLKVEVAASKDPLVVLMDVLNYNTDDDIIRAISNQNAHLLAGLSKEEVRVAVKYRRRARNALESHVVLQVSPKVWQRLTEAERVHVDLQRIRVFDQTPLIQCTRCLRFGHGRKHCTEGTDLCSHCNGPHLRADCPAKIAGEPPSCGNCVLAKNGTADHDAFSTDCPVRRKWDAMARSSTAYHC